MVKPKVGLFVTCLVDLMRPSVGLASATLIEAAGCDVVVPPSQTCCGQPAYNSGDKKTAIAIAKATIASFEALDYVVAPSGSCAGMIKAHYPALLKAEPSWHKRAVALAAKTYELLSFLYDVRGMRQVDATVNARVTYHDSCSGLRELKVKGQPRALLASVKGLSLVEMDDNEVCCGFGGTFSIKYPDISNAMVQKKTDNVGAVAPDLLLAGDLGCLMNMAGKLKRQGSEIEVRHVAEVLVGDLSAPAIGEKA